MRHGCASGSQPDVRVQVFYGFMARCFGSVRWSAANPPLTTRRHLWLPTLAFATNTLCIGRSTVVKGFRRHGDKARNPFLRRGLRQSGCPCRLQLYIFFCASYFWRPCALVAGGRLWEMGPLKGIGAFGALERRTKRPKPMKPLRSCQDLGGFCQMLQQQVPSQRHQKLVGRMCWNLSAVVE